MVLGRIYTSLTLKGLNCIWNLFVRLLP